MRVLWLNPVLVIVLASTLLLCGRSAKAQELPVGAEGVLLERDIEFDRVTAEKGLDGFLSFIAEEAAFSPPTPTSPAARKRRAPFGGPCSPRRACPCAGSRRGATWLAQAIWATPTAPMSCALSMTTANRSRTMGNT